MCKTVNYTQIVDTAKYIAVHTVREHRLNNVRDLKIVWCKADGTSEWTRTVFEVHILL